MKKNFILIIIILILNIIASNSINFATWYAKNVSKIFINTIGRICSFIPISIFEWLVIVLVISLLIIVIKFRSITLIIRYLLIIILIFTLTTGINYHRATLEKEMSFTRLEYNNDDLKKLCNYITDILISLNADEISTKTIRSEAKTAINKIIPGYYPNPKPMFFSKLMTMGNLSGIFSPFTIEANYNKDMPTYNKPFSICHEFSHLAGYMSEDEANFLAYLACINSNNTYFNYSGYLTAFIYVTNALNSNNIDVSIYYDRLPDTIINDLQKNNKFWQQYNNIIALITDNINDTYLKINSVSEGTNSYSMFVDLLYSYCIAQELL